MRPALVKALVLAVAIAIGLWLAEQLLRLVDYEYRPVSIDTRTTEDARYFHLFGSDDFVYDPELIWRPKVGREPFNEQGFRGPVMATAGRAARRGRMLIVAVGDSNTLGWAGEDGANWPLLLADRLRAAGVDAEVVNAGVWGYSSFQGLTRVRQLLPFEPDLVLVSFGANDAHRVHVPDREFARRSRFVRTLERRLVHFRVGQLLIAVVRAARSGRTEPEERVPESEYLSNLVRMAELARAAGAEVALMTRPYEGDLFSETTWKSRGPAYNRATLEAAVAAGVELVDLYTHFKARPELFADESHFTAAGHERAAEVIALELGQILARISDAG